MYMRGFVRKAQQAVSLQQLSAKPNGLGRALCDSIMTVHVYFVRMDKKGGDNDVIYPDIMFCVDRFEEVQSIYTSIDVYMYMYVHVYNLPSN